MKEIEKLAIIDARRVMNRDDPHEEAVYTAGFMTGFRKAREMAEQQAMRLQIFDAGTAQGIAHYIRKLGESEVEE